MYAIQGNAVRWFFSPEEDEHLFANLGDQYDMNAEITIHGNWNEGLTFKPILRKGWRPPDGGNGSFPIINVPGATGKPIKSIATPIEYLKVSRVFINNLKPTAVIRCKRTADRRELIVYPQIAEIVEVATSSLPPPQPTDQKEVELPSMADISGSIDQDEVIESELQSDTEEVDESVVEPSEGIVEPVSNEGVSDNQQQVLDTVGWASELVQEINRIIESNPSISAVISESGKEIKFVRKVVKRRQII